MLHIDNIDNNDDKQITQAALEAARKSVDLALQLRKLHKCDRCQSTTYKILYTPRTPDGSGKSVGCNECLKGTNVSKRRAALKAAAQDARATFNILCGQNWLTTGIPHMNDIVMGAEDFQSNF